MSVVSLDPSDSATVSIEWNGLSTSTITSVTYSLPSPLAYTNAGINNENNPPITNLTISGAEHGQSYMCEAQVVLNTGEILNRQFLVKGFNS